MRCDPSVSWSLRSWTAPGRVRPLSVRDVLDELRGERTLAYTTVMTVIDNLHRKGWLTRHQEGRAYLYRPAASPGVLRRRADEPGVRPRRRPWRHAGPLRRGPLPRRGRLPTPGSRRAPPPSRPRREPAVIVAAALLAWAALLALGAPRRSPEAPGRRRPPPRRRSGGHPHREDGCQRTLRGARRWHGGCAPSPAEPTTRGARRLLGATGFGHPLADR